MRPTAYPLSWPSDRSRTEATDRRASRFNVGGRNPDVADGSRRLWRELQMLEATDIVVSTNIELRLDGIPRRDRRGPSDPGVAVWFKLHGQDRVLACDRWLTVGQNLCAVAAHIDALRGIERWGVGTVEQAFEGHRALPAPRAWHEVLGISATSTLDEINDAHRALARKQHPDRGGSVSVMQQLNAARDEGRQACGSDWPGVGGLGVRERR